MSKLTFQGLDVGKVEPGDDLVELIVETTRDECALQDGEGVPNSGGLIRRGLRKTIQLTTRMNAREWF